MKNRFLLGVFLFGSFLAQAQLSPDYPEKNFHKKPKSFSLDIMEQKKEGGEFVTTKHKRYEIDVAKYRWRTQRVYDTIYNIPYNKEVTYAYEGFADKLLVEMTTKDMEGNLKEKEVNTYDDRALLLIKKELFNDRNELVATTTYNFGDCKEAAYTEGLPSGIVYTCEEITTNKPNIGTTKQVLVNNMTGVVKEMNYGWDGKLSSTFFYEYDENGKLSKESKTVASGHGYETTYTYNDKGDKLHTKASFVEFFYEYTYDEKGNWIEMIETSKVPNKRTVFKRTLQY